MNYNISANELDLDNVNLVDIRTKEEQEEGYFTGSIFAPVDFHNLDIDVFYEELLSKIDINKPIVLMCLSGARSNFLAQALINKGKNVKNLLGGIAAMSQIYPERIISND